MFNSLASVLAGPPPKAVGMQTEGPFLLSWSVGWGPIPGNEGQYLASVSETTPLFIPIILGDTKNKCEFSTSYHRQSFEQFGNQA